MFSSSPTPADVYEGDGFSSATKVEPTPTPTHVQQTSLFNDFLSKQASRYHDDFVELHHLGKGAFGTVYKVLNMDRWMSRRS